VLVDADGRLIDVNDRAAAMYGYDHGGMLHLTARDLCANSGQRSASNTSGPTSPLSRIARARIVESGAANSCRR
ncbi:MAG: hypothetical protein RLZZ584_4008, partial [Pseudomonadota bacterium]